MSVSAHISELTSPETLTYVQAYWTAREKKTKPQPHVQFWNEKSVPMILHHKSLPPDEANSPYQPTMTGRIFLGLHIISGPGSLATSDAEKNKIMS